MEQIYISVEFFHKNVFYYKEMFKFINLIINKQIIINFEVLKEQLLKISIIANIKKKNENIPMKNVISILRFLFGK